MPRVDFYVLPEAAAEGPLPTACRLAEKAVASGKRVHAHAPDESAAAEFDRLLWIYKQGGFIAHERLEPGADQSMAAVLIGTAAAGGAPAPTHRDILLNLAPEVPPFYKDFERVLEIVHGDAAAKAASRARFKTYKDAGFTPETHKLTEA